MTTRSLSVFALTSFSFCAVALAPRSVRADDEPVEAPLLSPEEPAQPPPQGALAAEAAPNAPAAPFAWGDFTWMNGQSRQKDFPLKAFDGIVTMSLYLDANYAFSFNHPRDNTLTGTASVARHNEMALNLVSVGFDFNYKNVLGRLSLQYGSMLNIVQELDGSVQRGRSISTQNLRYIREATVGYHFDVLHGLNVEAGIFMSYIGLESYLLAENWNYTRSMSCEATPFYFHGARAQLFTSDRVKIEPWLMNGWQSYGKWNYAPSGGVALRWIPEEWLSLAANFYIGTDTKNVAERVRFHHDDSMVLRVFNAPQNKFVSKAAFSLNNHFGFESGGSLDGQALPGIADAHVVGTSLVQRTWFARDHLALSFRGEVLSNPTRYLAFYAPPGYATGPGTTPLQAWAVTATFDILPTDFFAVRVEGSYRRSNTPYFAGPGGTTSPDGYQPIPDPTAGYVPDGAKDQTLAVLALNFRL